MKAVFIIQSIPEVLDLIKKKINATFPHLKNVIYESNFEKILAIIPEDEEIVVIASDFYHDDENILFLRKAKDGSRLAEEIKKINPLAKVYIFSTYEPRKKFVDGFFSKSLKVGEMEQQIVDIFFRLRIN